MRATVQPPGSLASARRRVALVARSSAHVVATALSLGGAACARHHVVTAPGDRLLPRLLELDRTGSAVIVAADSVDGPYGHESRDVAVRLSRADRVRLLPSLDDELAGVSPAAVPTELAVAELVRQCVGPFAAGEPERCPLRLDRARRVELGRFTDRTAKPALIGAGFGLVVGAGIFAGACLGDRCDDSPRLDRAATITGGVLAVLAVALTIKVVWDCYQGAPSCRD